MLRILAISIWLTSTSVSAVAQSPQEIIDTDLYASAIKARDAVANEIENKRYLTIIDYRQHSSRSRMYLVDLESDTVEQLLVAHGRGSDLDHDGMAEQFSNTPNSKMSSLGAFTTGETYYGRHGLSLKLHGLDPENSNALSRAIVMHGADYVAPGRKLGRSWGCPALEQHEAQRVIPMIKGGSFLYIVGAPQTVSDKTNS